MANDHARQVRKGHLKRAIGVLVALAAVAGFIGVMALLAQVIIYTGTGADPATALNIIPAVPPNLEKRLIWLPDAPSTLDGRQLEPVVRDKLSGAYLRAWAQMAISYAIGQPYGLATYFGGPAYAQITSAISETVASGWSIEQSDLRHALELTFYAEDGNVIAFTDRAVRLVQQYSGKQHEEYVVETDAVYDVVMVLEDGNWRIRAWRRRESPVAVVDELVKPAGIATVNGDGFMLNDERLHLHGVNYYPSDTPWTLFWENYDPKVIDADLAKMEEMGLNTVRIFVPFEDFGGDEVDRLRRGRLLDFLNRSDAHGIKVIVTLFDHRTDHNIANWAADDQHLGQIVPGLTQHRALLAWDIKNEADRDDKANGQALNHAWLRHVANEIRSLDPNHLLTIGWSTPEAAAALTDVVDFISYHDYGAPDSYPQRLATLQAAADGKPLVLSEFGRSTWKWLLPASWLEREQADYVDKMMAAQAQAETAGELVWTLYDFTTVPLPEYRFPWQKAVQAHMGILDSAGVPKPAAKVFAPMQ